jgi:hypothetical protein
MLAACLTGWILCMSMAASPTTRLNGGMGLVQPEPRIRIFGRQAFPAPAESQFRKTSWLPNGNEQMADKRHKRSDLAHFFVPTALLQLLPANRLLLDQPAPTAFLLSDGRLALQALRGPPNPFC